MTIYEHRRKPLPIASLATCTWAVRIADGTYVADPEIRDAKLNCTPRLEDAYLWVDVDGESARRWIEKHRVHFSVVQRARP